MAIIYNGQTAFKLILELGIDITGATCLVKYRKPSGDINSWNAVISDATAGTIYGIPESADDLDEIGKYTFWGYATFSDGSSAAGEPAEIQIYEEGRIIIQRC